MKWLSGFFLAVALPLLLSEFTDWCPWFARRLVGRAARRLPKECQARWEEEWLDHLYALEGRRLAILVRGLWIYLCSPRWGRMLQGFPPVSKVLLGRIKALVKRPQQYQEEQAQRVVFGQPGGGKTEALLALLTSVNAEKLTVTVTQADQDHCLVDVDTATVEEYRLEAREQEISNLLRSLQTPHDEHPIKIPRRFFR